MIFDLALAGEATVATRAQVCIVGAGTAGLFLAHVLRRQGVEVTVLEAGDAVARSPTEMGVACELRGGSYRGTELGRRFGLGGTSAVWGGQLIPLSESDMSARPKIGLAPWPISYADVAKHFPVVRQHFELQARALSRDTELDDPLNKAFPHLQNFNRRFSLRVSEWLPFRKRNIATVLGGALARDPGLTVWLNSAVTGMTRTSVDGSARIDSITARSASGRTLQVRASTVVICAGALESTRLLLELDESLHGWITGAGSPLGHHFADHLSRTCGRLACRDWHRYRLAVAPIFRSGAMRSPRLELTAAAQRELGLPSAFAHFASVTSEDSGFSAVRRLLHRSQARSGDSPLNWKAFGRALKGLPAMAYWRAAYRRLWIPKQADLLLQVDVEQLPNAGNRLYLSPERDSLKRKKLVVDWRIQPADMEAIRRVTEVVAEAWKHSPLSGLADLQPLRTDEADSLANPYDVYHPAGTIRMGSSPASSVVNGDLRLWAAGNCYVSSTAVFPSTGGANPGLTHLAMTARLGELIARQYSR